MVPISPNGTLTRNTYLQLNTASMPPSINPKNIPDIIATVFIPNAFPRSVDGKASVIIAALFAIKSALPTACTTLNIIISNAPASPVDGVKYNNIEAKVNIRKPNRNILTLPYISESRPKLNSNVAVTNP